MGHRVLATTDVWKKKRDDLTSKRNALFKKYSKNPHDLHLALEIKTIDDEIAEYTEKMTKESLSERKSKSLPLVPSKN
ncbi:MAG TPA: hypothetical protein VN943_06805 [Candidatus Acidoferrum sp.]|nr:hypothetical protein [Candidatus Acidoferrum sp.]